MRVRLGLVTMAAVCSLACTAYADDDDSKGHARAEKRCAREAEDQGLRVEKVGDAEKVGKKQYEVRLRVEDRGSDRWDRGDRRRDRDDEFRVVCQYDDRDKRARLQ